MYVRNLRIYWLKGKDSCTRVVQPYALYLSPDDYSLSASKKKWYERLHE